MPRRLVTLAAVAWCIVAGLRVQSQARFPAEIQFFVEIVDADGKPVPGVKASDIFVRESGIEGTVMRVESIDWPVNVALLVDNGRGMASFLSELRSSLKALIRALPAEAPVSIVTTAPQPREIVRPTDDRVALNRGVDRVATDTGNARFVEAIMEAASRFDRDKERRYFPVVIALGTSNVDGSEYAERDLQQMGGRLLRSAATVHVVMLNTGAGAVEVTQARTQNEVGLTVTTLTGGRYEAISAHTRLLTLLPEIGEQVAKSHARQSHQYRVTFKRPAARTGEVGTIDMATVQPAWRGQMSPDGRLR